MKYVYFYLLVLLCYLYISALSLCFDISVLSRVFWSLCIGLHICALAFWFLCIGLYIYVLDYIFICA